MALGDDHFVTGKQPRRPHDQSFNTENAGSEQGHGPAEVRMNLRRSLIEIEQARIGLESNAYGRREVPLGGNGGRKGEREQENGGNTLQKTRGHYVTSLRNSVANSDLVTLPAGS